MFNQLKLDYPAFYHIRVQGALSPRWADYLGGVNIVVDDEQETPCTTLEGEILDQATLLGILNSLYNLGFPLLMVEYKSASQET